MFFGYTTIQQNSAADATIKMLQTSRDKHYFSEIHHVNDAIASLIETVLSQNMKLIPQNTQTVNKDTRPLT